MSLHSEGRLGVLGFFNIPGMDFKGNYGILDQVRACHVSSYMTIRSSDARDIFIVQSRKIEESGNFYSLYPLHINFPCFD